MPNPIRSLVASSCLVFSLILAGCASGNSNSGGSTPTPTPTVAAPTVTTIAPAAVGAGAGATTLTVNGSGFTSTTVVQVNAVSEATTYVSANQVTAVVPATQLATGVLLPVTALNGTLASSAVTLEVDNPAPAITQFSPAFVATSSGPVTVTATGTGFIASTTLQVNGSARPTTFVSGTQVTASLTTADFAAAGALAITAVNAGPGGGTSTPGSLPVNNATPAITAITPAAVTAGAAASTVTITGSGFLPATVIRVNGAARTTTFVSATQITGMLTVADFASAGSLALTAFTPAPGGGASSPLSLTVNNPVPAITQLAPTAVTAGAAATTVTITGTGFVAGSVVQSGGSARTTTYVSATQVTVSLTAADLAMGGALSLTVVNAAPGGGTSAAASLTVNNPVPAITQLAPATLIAGASDTAVTVTGTGFVAATVVKAGGVARATVYFSATQVSVTLTAADLSASGSISLVATNPTPGGGSSAAASVAVNYGFPTITGFSPTSLSTGKTTPTAVTINGTNFDSQTMIQVNSQARASTFVSATQISFTATALDQAYAGNLVFVAINPPFFTGTNVSAPASLPVSGPTPTPVITSVSPNTFVAGSPATVIAVYGSGLTASSSVLWNGTALPGSYYYSFQPSLSVTVPANLLASVGTASITVSTPTSAVPLSNAVSVSITNPPAPTLTSISPAYAPINTAVTLTVIGTGFTNNSTLSINGVSVPATNVSATGLTANVPASALTLPGSLGVTVTTPAPGGGTSGSLPFMAYVGMANNSMIYNPVNGLFYLSVPSSAGAPYGNSVVSVDPATGALGTPIYVGSEPNKLAITADGKFLWVGLDGASAVRKVDLTANTAGLQFNLVPPTGYSPGTALALAALPGATDSVLVSSSTSSYYSIGVAIYDSGVARGNPASTSTYYNSAYALAVNGTLGEVYVGAGGTYYVFTYGSTGLTLKTTATNGNYTSSSPYDEFQVAGGILYTDYGKAYDPEAGTLQGTFYASGSTVAQGATTADTTLGKVFVIDSSSGSYYSANQIQIFNTADYNQTTSSVIPLSIPSYLNTTNYTQLYPSRLTRWGANGLAFRQANGFYPLRSNLVKDLSTTLADVSVTLASSGSTTTGASTTYTATVTNAGPSAATSVALSATPPATGILVSAIASAGSCSISGIVSCNLGGLALNASATVTFVVTQTASGSATFTAQVSASETDSNQGNNLATISPTITGNAYNPLPVLSAVSPSAVIAGSTDTLISVTGTNFSSGSTIQVGGTALSTNYVSATRLTATIPTNQLTSLGWLPVTVSSPAPGGGTSAALPFSIFSIVNLSANRMLFDPYTRKIMASVASTSTAVTGNSLIAVTPETGTIGTPVPIGSQPSNLALTDDSQILYVSLLGSNSVARFNMLTQAADFTVPIPSPSSYSSYVPGPIATVPGTENSIALNVGNGIGLYDFNTTAKTAAARTNFASIYNSTCIGFLDASHLLTTNYSGGITSNPLTSTGFGTSTTSALSAFNNCFQISGTRAFAATGGVANLATTPFSQAGSFPATVSFYYGSPFTVADTSLQRSFFLANATPNSAYIDSVAIYDQNTFLLNSMVSLNIEAHESNSNYTLLDFLRWGQDGLAILSSGGHIYLLRGGTVVPQLLNTNTVATLSSSSTATVTHGAGNLLLTLTGANFVPGVAVSWNGSYRTTTIVDATHVTVAIPASDLATAGTGSLVATNPGASSSTALTVTIN